MSKQDDRFRSLYQRYYLRMVRFYVRAFRLSEEDAEELTQDAFLRFYQAMEEYRGDAEWAFFQKIAMNLGYNRIRTQKTLKRTGTTVRIDDPDSGIDPPAPPADDLADREQEALQKRQLYAAIAELPAGQRQCVMLLLDELSYEQIAKGLRISLDAVKSRIRDAKKTLRARLGSDVLLPEDEA